jgi:hypothetical protein
VVAGDLVGLADAFQNAVGECARLAHSVDGDLQHDEFIAADSRHAVNGARAAVEPHREPTQQSIADRMAQRVVDFLEPIEIDA